METTRHFTATTIIVYKDKTLLHLHKKLDKWLPVGGHIDRDELPEEAAVREAKEESGLDVELLSMDKSIDYGDAKQLIRPAHIILEDINEFHQHIDLIYFSKIDTDELNPSEGESGEIKWFTADEVSKLDKIHKNTITLCLEAIKLFNKE